MNSSEWVILHCCKDPFHKELVGYRGNLPPNHPDYKFKISGRRMALNLVDMDVYNPKYLEFNLDMFIHAFRFLDSFQGSFSLLFHCNQGESRAPSLTMLYLKHLGYYDNKTFSEAYEEFKAIYPIFKPKDNIIKNVEGLWNKF